MQVEITLKNYRCFPDEKPARIFLQKGFTGLVGVNNSGKSSLLKFFYEFRNLFGRIRSNGNFIKALRGDHQSFEFAGSVLDHEEVFSNANNRDIEVEFKFVKDNSIKQSLESLPKRLTLTIPRRRNEWTAKLEFKDGSHTPPKSGEEMNIRNQTILHFGNSPRADLTILNEVSNILQRTLYIGPFRNAINIGTKDDYFDIQVGQSFIRNWRAYKTGNVKRNNEAAYNLTQDIKDIFRFDSLEINPSPDDQTLQVFINERSYKLLELGSGLAQFIIVLANVAIKQPSYILIDEPELNLHPSLQLDFLTTLASYASEGVLFATHSIGLARAAADRIYSLRQDADGMSELTDIETTPRLSEFLGELSFSGYRELGFEKVLLVEGSSNIKTFQQLLRLYKKDHKVVLLPLGGSDMIKKSVETELQEIKRITDNVFAVIDSERDAPDASLEEGRAAFMKDCQNANINCHVLERRAIENYFSERAVQRVKGEKYRALAPYEKLGDGNFGWSKTADNWRIAREMTLDDLEATDLGKFLGSL